LSKVFEVGERRVSLGGQTLGAVAAEFHEDTRAAALAADTVSLSVERFEASAGGAFVVNEFNHFTLSKVGDRASCFEPVATDLAVDGNEDQRPLGVGPEVFEKFVGAITKRGHVAVPHDG
jgi:hypothetical protein